MSSFTRRLLGAALAGALLLTVVSITPAQGHVTSSFTHLWKHIKKKADARYLQKAKAPIPSRTAGVQSDAFVAITGQHTTMQTSITAPAAGFLVIEARGVFFTSPTPLLHCGISVDGSGSWPSTFSLSSNVEVAGSTGTCPVSTRIPVTAGTHTVGYAVHNDGSGTASFYGGSISVTYVAYGASGVVGTGREMVTPSGGDINKR
jgi:hypothetical protein